MALSQVLRVRPASIDISRIQNDLDLPTGDPDEYFRAGNEVRQASSSTVFSGVSSPRARPDDLSDEIRGFLKFNVSNVADSTVHNPFFDGSRRSNIFLRGDHRMSFGAPGGGKITSTLTIYLMPLSLTWDATTLTWDNQPAVPTDKTVIKFVYDLGVITSSNSDACIQTIRIDVPTGQAFVGISYRISAIGNTSIKIPDWRTGSEVILSEI